jgi:hypothetical protein
VGIFGNRGIIGFSKIRYLRSKVGKLGKLVLF